ncbi:Hypothetical predicted protein [Lecanosticta acicola]|uniref:BTB domain-containing protein n=1 Tax=Lecanosticta acicola TaxID=111012 RepID=A0AAI8W1S8_9PEZI|nr:Hypothetical predicted protein [Lecanosticta acicola]
MSREVGETSTPPEKRFMRDYTEVITVLVGPEEKSFILHKDAICSESTVFTKACSQRWEEGRELKPFKPLFTGSTAKKHNATEESVNAFPSWSSYGKLWALAHYLDHTPLRDAVIDCMLQKIEALPQLGVSLDTLCHIFESTPQNSTIQRLLLEYTAASMTPARLQKEAEKLPFPVVIYLAWKCTVFTSSTFSLPKFENRWIFHEREKETLRYWDGVMHDGARKLALTAEGFSSYTEPCPQAEEGRDEDLWSYESITAVPGYRDRSFEELRLKSLAQKTTEEGGV